jgi:protein-disulfide isomerase
MIQVLIVKTINKTIMENDSSRSTATITISTPMAIIVAGAIIGVAIYASNTSPTSNPTTAGVNQTTTTQPTPVPTVGPMQVSLDDDPVLGNPDAPVTMVEFSDYECPFCKRHFESSYPQLKADFIDTGKVKLVFRDLPLPFHEPMATQDALAANCAREQGGDDAYYRYHDKIFEKTLSNGNGITPDALYDIANELNLNRDEIKTCVEEERSLEEIQADAADANAIGISATPTFIVGLSDGDTITGTPIIGAQPYPTVIKPAIEALLAETGS